jgi:hypothetical protein
MNVWKETEVGPSKFSESNSCNKASRWDAPAAGRFIVFRGSVEVFQVTLVCKCLDQDAQSTQVH